jgi:hypothetical protein
MDLFSVVNFVLAAVMYTLLGRFLLSLVFDDRSQAVIWTVFRQVTQPLVDAAALVTPAVVPTRIVILFAALWCLALRMLLYVLLRMYGLAPSIG